MKSKQSQYYEFKPFFFFFFFAISAPLITFLTLAVVVQ